MSNNGVPVMDNDASMKEDSQKPTPRVRLILGPNADVSSKRKAAPTPEHHKLDDARSSEQYHKQAATEARQQRRAAIQENDNLRAQLSAAQNDVLAHQDEVRRLHILIEEGRSKLEEKSRDEGNLHAQIMHDQDRLADLLQRVTAAQNQAAEASTQSYRAQETLNVRDEEVDRLRAEVCAQEDEVERLRQQIKMAARTKAQPLAVKRRGRVSTKLFNPGRPSVMELPLDPAPLPNERPTLSAPTSDSGPDSSPDMEIEAIAAKLDMDVGELAKFLAVMKLVNGNNVNVAIGPSEATGRKAKPKAEADAKAAVAPQDKELVNVAHAMMRNITYRKFGYNQASDFIFHVSATEDEVSAFAENDEATVTKWQFDFNDDYTNSAWNAAQMERLVDEAVKEDYAGMRYLQKGLIKREYLELIVTEQLARYYAEWKQFRPRWDMEEGRMETKAEAIARGKVVLYHRRTLSKTINGQHNKYDHRRTTVEATIALKEADGGNDLTTWKRMLDLLDLLGPSGMSEEEETHSIEKGAKIKVYKIKLCVWREPAIVDYMRMVDAQTMRFQALHNGTKPAPCVRAQMHGDRPPPKGLPKCLYNPEWLESLSPREVRALKVSKNAFALFVAATERMAK
ncbi:unnamed protein product [Mycena citricolor]|uniref:Uncharacterized protein n=1 Tax=Mycena citricolor TaxID=2018698 RepID=A0AAD2Q2F6_9AGAR|nr:unnamed protein product [Mycena citricolor]